jgi:hypothetical protein
MSVERIVVRIRSRVTSGQVRDLPREVQVCRPALGEHEIDRTVSDHLVGDVDVASLHVSKP